MVPRYFNSKPHRSWWLLTSCCTKDDFDCLWKLFIYIDVLWTSSHPWTGELKNAFYFNRSVALRWKSPLIKKRLPSILYDWKTKDYKRCIQNGALWLFCHMAQYTCIPFVILTLIVSVCVCVFFEYLGVQSCKCIIHGHERSNPSGPRGFARYHVQVLWSGVRSWMTH